MKIAIISAMDKEHDLLLARMKNYGTPAVRDFGLFKAHIGKIGKHEVLAMTCGIGKVNSALRTLRLIDAYAPDMVINSGVAGGVDVSMKIGSVLVSEGVAYHDVWCGPGTEWGAADGFPRILLADAGLLEAVRALEEKDKAGRRFGLICSGDVFVSRPEEVLRIKKHFPEALGCDMESGSIAQTCALCKVPFIAIRVLSDMPGGGENISEYENFWDEAPERTFETVLSLVESLK